MYHTRFSGSGEKHEVRVHELLPTADGWLVAAPYEYMGTKADKKGYKTADIAGDYEMVTHDKSSYFKGPKKVTDKTSTVYRGVNKPINITLKEDGTVTGDQTGTWEAVEGANQMTLKLTGDEGEVTYSGAFDKLPRDKDRKAVMTFSALGTNTLCIWGSQK